MKPRGGETMKNDSAEKQLKTLQKKYDELRTMTHQLFDYVSPPSGAEKIYHRIRDLIYR